MQNLLVRRIDQSVFCVHCRKVKETQTYTAPGGFGLEVKRDVFLALSIVIIFLIEIISITSSFWDHITQISVRNYLYIIGTAWARRTGYIRVYLLYSGGQSHRPVRWQLSHRANSVPFFNLESRRGTHHLVVKHGPRYFSCARLDSLPRSLELVSYNIPMWGIGSGRNRAFQLFNMWQSNHAWNLTSGVKTWCGNQVKIDLD